MIFTSGNNRSFDFVLWFCFRIMASGLLEAYSISTYVSLLGRASLLDKNHIDKCSNYSAELAVHATVFHTWKQRNKILHNSKVIPHQPIFKNIDREIRNTISARRHKKHFRKLMLINIHRKKIKLNYYIWSIYLTKRYSWYVSFRYHICFPLRSFKYEYNLINAL